MRALPPSLYDLPYIYSVSLTGSDLGTQPLTRPAICPGGDGQNGADQRQLQPRGEGNGGRYALFDARCVRTG
jgi:hypothetical protein